MASLKRFAGFLNRISLSHTHAHTGAVSDGSIHLERSFWSHQTVPVALEKLQRDAHSVGSSGTAAGGLTLSFSLT